jgi:hypothetical protein
MNITRLVIHRLHQTPLSRAIRRSPTLNHFAERWWVASQSRIFLQGLRGIRAPQGSPSGATPAGQSPPSIPPLEDAVAKLPAYVAAGEDFSAEMARHCSTSKFLSVTVRRDSCGYQDIYAQILRHLRGKAAKMLEIGIGVNDPTSPSGMPAEHVTGASLVGWSRYFPGGEIHGADVDPRCMQQSESFTTHLVDQRDPASLERLGDRIGGDLDLVVDDGLHTPEANINVMAAFMPLLAPTGLLVIEDISAEFDTLWFRAQKEMPSEYTMTYFPSSVLRQFRGAGGQGGIAVIARHQ